MTNTENMRKQNLELVHYHRLHDGLSEAIESGRLTRANLPEDYEWLVHMLTTVPGKAQKSTRNTCFQGNE